MFFSHIKSASVSSQSIVFFSYNKSVSATSHSQPNKTNNISKCFLAKKKVKMKRSKRLETVDWRTHLSATYSSGLPIKRWKQIFVERQFPSLPFLFLPRWPQPQPQPNPIYQITTGLRLGFRRGSLSIRLQ